MKTSITIAAATLLAGCSMLPAGFAGKKTTNQPQAAAQPTPATAGTALPPPATAGTALPPVPDNGFVSEVHKTHVGKVVFANAVKSVTTPETPSEFATKLSLSDSIYFRAYLPRSIKNAFRAEGVECVRNEARRVFRMTIDGKPVGAELYSEHAKSSEDIYTKSTSVQFDQPLNATADLGTKAIWRSFGDFAVPMLTEGTHEITLTVTASCTAHREDYPHVALSAPLASGSFTLTVSAKELADASRLGTHLPKPALKNPKLEREMVDAIKQKWRDDEIYRVVIVEKEWRVRLHDISRLPVDRVIGTLVTAKQSDGKCSAFRVTFVQPALGNNKWGDTAYNSVGDATEMRCDAAK